MEYGGKLRSSRSHSSEPCPQRRRSNFHRCLACRTSRGIYFAEKSGYSDQYAFRPSRQGGVTVDRPLGGDDEREMFLSKLLVGKAVEMDGYNTLTAPPLDDRSKMRYNTVTGTQCGSPIYIVYENGRAYPEYLVRYYRSQHRDTQRTPYRNKEEAKRSRASSGDSSGSGTSGGVVWEFMDTTEWKSYSVSHQNTLETAYKNYVNDGSGSKKIVDIRTSEWAYRVDLATMVQTNVGHASRTQRGLFNAEPSLLPLIPFSRPRMMPLYGSSWTETDGDRIQCRSSLPWKLRTKVQ
jgi:WWE domain